VFYASTVAPASSLVPFTALANRDRCRLLGGQRRAGIQPTSSSRASSG